MCSKEKKIKKMEENVLQKKVKKMYNVINK